MKNSTRRALNLSYLPPEILDHYVVKLAISLALSVLWVNIARVVHSILLFDISPPLGFGMLDDLVVHATVKDGARGTRGSDRPPADYSVNRTPRFCGG